MRVFLTLSVAASLAVESVTDNLSIGLILLTRIFRSIAAGIINVVLPFLVLKEMNESLFTLGLIYTAATLATAGLGFFIGFATDYSRKATYVFALALLPLSTALIYYSQSLAIVFLAAMVGGFASTGSLAGGGIGGAAQPIQSTVITDVTSRLERTYYYGIMSFVAGLASAAGAFLVYAEPSFTATALLGIATVLSAISVPPALFVKTSKSSKKPRSFKLHSGKVIGKFGLTGLLNGLANGLVTPFLIPFFIVTYGFTQDTMALYTMVAGIIGACVFLLAPRLEHILGFVKGVIITRGATIFMLLVFPFVKLLPISLGIYLAYPAFRVAAFPVIQSAMMDMVDEDERGRLFGVNQATRLTASSAGTAFAGYEFDMSAIGVPFVAYALILGVNLFMYSKFFSYYRDPLKKGKKVT